MLGQVLGTNGNVPFAKNKNEYWFTFGLSIYLRYLSIVMTLKNTDQVSKTEKKYNYEFL